MEPDFYKRSVTIHSDALKITDGDTNKDDHVNSDGFTDTHTDTDPYPNHYPYFNTDSDSLADRHQYPHGDDDPNPCFYAITDHDNHHI